MKFYKILIILVIVVVVVFAVLSIVVDMFQGPPPKMVARFNGGNPVSSDVRITDVFHVQKKEWSISLSSGIQILDWSLEIELYEEGGNIPLCSLKGKWDLLGDRVVWERGPGTTGGTFNVPYEYQPDLPPGTYYLAINWTRITWTIEIYENMR